MKYLCREPALGGGRRSFIDLHLKQRERSSHSWWHCAILVAKVSAGDGINLEGADDGVGEEVIDLAEGITRVSEALLDEGGWEENSIVPSSFLGVYYRAWAESLWVRGA